MSDADRMMAMMKAVVQTHDDTHNAAHDLWSWLPTYQCEIEKPGTETPDPATVMHEACELLSVIKEHHPDLIDNLRKEGKLDALLEEFTPEEE